MKPLLFLLAVLTANSALSQSSGRFAVTRNVVAFGGASLSTSSRFQLGSTIGQPSVGVPSNGRFSVQGGFWIWPAPGIFSPTKIGNSFIFSFQTEPGKTYVAQYLDSLASTNWENLPGIVGDGSVKTVTNSVPNVTQRFYRLIER